MKHPVLIHDPTLGHWLFFENPVRILTTRRLDEIRPALQEIEAAVNQQGLFAAGFISYEAAPAFDPALKVRPDNSGFPFVWFGLYPPPLASTHCPLASVVRPLSSDLWTPSITTEDYARTVAKLRQYLFDGDTYQVNYTFRLAQSLQASPESIFHTLVEAQGAHYSAFVDTGDFALCSASPELFFRLDGDRLESRPMKGTIQRGKSAEEDRRQAHVLRDSPKNRAENVMIVDMVRNDMGRVAIPGSVIAERLFDVERYPTVWQMVSTVTAKTHASIGEILAALFPCASITGAPKARTMEIIAQEETTPRRIYTGSIGYIAPGRRAQFNVAIRTLLLDKTTGMAEYGVGGGIVWDSESDSEYEECWLKARVLTEKQPDFKLLETLLWTPDDGYFLLDRHLKRLEESAEYFDIPLSLPDLCSMVDVHCSKFKGNSAHRIRLLVARDGGITLDSTPFTVDPGSAPVRVRLAATPVDPEDRFLYHKTTHRTVYEQAKAGVPDDEDVLLWNTRGELTESTIANVVVELEGKRLTPPVTSGLLPGVFRAELIEKGEITEAAIRLQDLPRCDAIYLVNSVRKWRKATLTTPQ